MFLSGSRPVVRRGTRCAGRIVKLMVGQGYGYIRLSGDRDVYFHRADLHDGVSFNELEIDERVTCEVLEDNVSGARAVQVRRAR